MSQNAGQNCIGIERVIVHSSQYDEVYQLLVERASGLRCGSALTADSVGSGVDCSSMISSQRFEVLEQMIKDAGSHGAKIELGGDRLRHPYLESGAYFAPTVIGNVTPDMNVAKQECMSFYTFSQLWNLMFV